MKAGRKGFLPAFLPALVNMSCAEVSLRSEKVPRSRLRRSAAKRFDFLRGCFIIICPMHAYRGYLDNLDRWSTFAAEARFGLAPAPESGATGFDMVRLN